MRFLITSLNTELLRDGLVAEGHDVVCEPLIVHEDVDARVPPPSDWLLLTSAHGAHRAHALGITGAKVAAVGWPTASAYGRADLVGEGTGGELVDQMVASDGGLAGKTVVWVRAEQGAASTIVALRKAKATLVDVIAYRNTGRANADQALAGVAAAGEWDVVLLASPSAVDVYCTALAALRAKGSPVGDRARLVAIGPTTADACRSRGQTVVVATTWDARGVLSAIG